MVKCALLPLNYPQWVFWDPGMSFSSIAEHLGRVSHIQDIRTCWLINPQWEEPRYKSRVPSWSADRPESALGQKSVLVSSQAILKEQFAVQVYRLKLINRFIFVHSFSEAAVRIVNMWVLSGSFPQEKHSLMEPLSMDISCFVETQRSGSLNFNKLLNPSVPWLPGLSKRNIISAANSAELPRALLEVKHVNECFGLLFSFLRHPPYVILTH